MYEIIKDFGFPVAMVLVMLSALALVCRWIRDELVGMVKKNQEIIVENTHVSRGTNEVLNRLTKAMEKENGR
jgi:hypothetical protein